MKLDIDFKVMRPKRFNSNMYKSTEKLAKNVEKKTGNKIIAKCPLCGTKKNKIYAIKYNIPIVTCINCDLTYAKKQPKNLNDVYSNETYLTKSILSYDKTRQYRIKRFGKERLNIIKKYKKKGSILDFGCGTGWFLEGAKKEFDVSGVEYSDTLREWLLEKFNIKTYKDLNEIDNNKFDIITAFDVIEHVPDPLKLLDDLKKKLKPNGIILIFTPNVNSLGFNYLKNKNNLLCPPNHLFYFNKKSFNFLCKKIGLKIIETQFKGLDIGDIYALLNDKKKNNVANYLNKNALKLQEFVDNIEYSNHVRFVLKNK